MSAPQGARVEQRQPFEVDQHPEVHDAETLDWLWSRIQGCCSVRSEILLFHDSVRYVGGTRENTFHMAWTRHAYYTRPYRRPNVTRKTRELVQRQRAQLTVLQQRSWLPEIAGFCLLIVAVLSSAGVLA